MKKHLPGEDCMNNDDCLSGMCVNSGGDSKNMICIGKKENEACDKANK